MAGGLGLCGKNPRKLALHGTEVFPCWEAMPVHDDAPSVREAGMIGPRGSEEHATRTFVPVEELRARSGKTVATAAPAGSGAGSTRWSLWGDPDA
jgi:hypothetical protein